MSVLSKDAILQVTEILIKWKGVLGGAPLSGGGKVLETFVALEIARAIYLGATSPPKVSLRNGQGKLRTTYVPRGAPGRIYGLGPPEPTCIHITAIRPSSGKRVELEVHQSVQWQCRLRAFHELDVCVIKLTHSTREKDEIGGARRLLGVECKQWTRPADIGVARQALALRHLLLTKRQSLVTTGAKNQNLAAFLLAAGPRYTYFAATPAGQLDLINGPAYMGLTVVKDVSI